MIGTIMDPVKLDRELAMAETRKKKFNENAQADRDQTFIDNLKACGFEFKDTNNDESFLSLLEQMALRIQREEKAGEELKKIAHVHTNMSGEA